MNAMFPSAQVTEETLQLARQAFSKGMLPSAMPLQKAGYNIAQGLEGYLLEAPSKKLFPVYSPLRNRIPRIPAPVGASATNWRQINGINTANLSPGATENTRNPALTTGTESKYSTFVSMGFDDYVGFEALARSKSFEDIRATAAVNLLYACMMGEERVILGGQATDIGAPATVTPTLVTSGGSLVDGAYYLKVSALTLDGVFKAQKAAGTATAEGESAGTASALVTISGGGNDDKITAVWAAVKGAAAYNVFIKKDSDAYKYNQTVYANYASVTAVTSGADANSTDETGDATVYTGMIGSIAAAATTGLYVNQNNVILTKDNAGGITELDNVMQAMWDTYRLGPDMILVNSQQAADITKLIGGSSNLAYRIVLQDGQKNVVGGIFVGSYLNKFASSFAEGIPNEVPIFTHPYMPAGTILLPVMRLPYPNNQVPNVWEIETLQEYTQYEWALTQRKYEFGIYWQSVLKPYFPKAQGYIQNVKAGIA